jgi:hypothetical protein
VALISLSARQLPCVDVLPPHMALPSTHPFSHSASGLNRSHFWLKTVMSRSTMRGVGET